MICRTRGTTLFAAIGGRFVRSARKPRVNRARMVTAGCRLRLRLSLQRGCSGASDVKTCCTRLAPTGGSLKQRGLYFLPVIAFCFVKMHFIRFMAPCQVGTKKYN